MTPRTLMIYEPYPMGLGGNYRTLSHILEHLDPAVLTPLLVAPEDTPALQPFRDRGIEVLIETPPASIHRFGGRVLRDSLLGRLRSAADVLRYNLRMGRLMRERGVDVVYANGIRAMLLVGLGARLARRPILWYVKGALENPFVDRVAFVLANRILFFCETNRDDQYRAFVRFFRRKIGIVEIGLDVCGIARVAERDHSALRAELDIRPDRLNAVVLGQVYPVKGQIHLMHALRRIVDRVPNFMLYVVGDHVLPEFRFYRTELEQVLEREGLRDHVCFAGWRSDALDIVECMDMLVHPAMAEGVGRAVLEGMALGKPVVASRVGGLREIVLDGENGFLVPPGDDAALAERVIAVASDPALRTRLGAAAKRRVTEHHRVEDKIRELQDIWVRMAEGSSRDAVA